MSARNSPSFHPSPLRMEVPSVNRLPHSSNTPSARNLRQVCFQLSQIDAGWHRSARCDDGVGFVDALVPPGPGALLGVAPGEHSYTIRIVGDGVDRVAVIG